MALRVMARGVGIPAFRQASVPRVSPSAGSGPLASRSSQAGYSNNTKADAARKMRHAEISKSAEKEVEEEVAKVKASFKEAREAIKDARRREARYWKVVLQAVPEVEDAKCECCGMSEECTPEYVRGVRGRFCGRWVCGLCATAVTEEAEKNGGDKEEALRAHMGVCKRFNGFGRTHPVLFQAEAMREILRRRAKLGPRSRSSINPREVRAKAASGTGGIARSSSCMPFITDESNDRVLINKK